MAILENIAFGVLCFVAPIALIIFMVTRPEPPAPPFDNSDDGGE